MSSLTVPIPPDLSPACRAETPFDPQSREQLRPRSLSAINRDRPARGGLGRREIAACVGQAVGMMGPRALQSDCPVDVFSAIATAGLKIMWDGMPRLLGAYLDDPDRTAEYRQRDVQTQP
jgi:hypothetical protein